MRVCVQDASDILSYFTNLKRRNEAASRDVDNIFMERQERERGISRLEEQIAELQRTAEVRIATLSPPLVAEYKALGEENRAATAEVERFQVRVQFFTRHPPASPLVCAASRLPCGCCSPPTHCALCRLSWSELTQPLK